MQRARHACGSQQAGIGDAGKEMLGSVVPRGARVVRRRRRLPFCATRRQSAVLKEQMDCGPIGTGH